MKQNNDDQGASPRRAAPQPTESKTIQQPHNNNGQYNRYADWTFEQLYSECKRRGLL